MCIYAVRMLSGGAVIDPKTPIGRYGFVAQFRDSEGNRVGLHSEV
jgi:hypothetical protein